MSEGERREGEVLDGRYRLARRLGRGGFGDVWRAEELLPDGTTLREVALKLLHGSVATAPDWSAEARIIASLRHPALVTVYAAGVLAAERPIPFVAMELLIGTSLAEQGGRVPWRRVTSWAREAGAALDVIHRAGVVHLDLKPANLFLAEEGLKVLDFGIARQGLGKPGAPGAGPAERSAPVDDMATAAFIVARAREEVETVPGGRTSPDSTSARSVVGTPGYMAPEIFEDGEASPATDAYALAACIVQLCTGRLPQQVGPRPIPASGALDASSSAGLWFADVQAATVRGQIRDLAVDHPELPRALVDLLLRWLSLDPQARGVERGSLRAALDEVWACPHGWAGRPYLGLQIYRPRDEGKLFGRGPDVARIGRDLADQEVGVVLHGESAIGLSSLALAGIVPELARRFADDKHDWTACEVELSVDGSPDDELARALRAHLAALDPDAAPASSAEGVESAVVDRLIARARYADVGTVIVLDRLERILAASEANRRQITALLAALSGEKTPGMRLVATANAEHVAALVELPEIGPSIQRWLRFVGPVPASAVAELVRGPAAEAGRALRGADEVIEELQGELAADPTRLPLLSLALARWWDHDGESLTAESWWAGGGVLGWLKDHAAAVHGKLSSADRQRVDAVLLRLLSADGSLVSVRASALLDASAEPAEMARVIERLRVERLIHQSGGMLRLTHVGLVEAWPHLSDLRLHHLDRLTFLEELRGAAARWAASGCLSKNLWPADMLRELGRRRAEIELDDDTRAFITASEQARRLMWVARGAALLLALGLVAGGFYIKTLGDRRESGQQARLEEARRAAAISRMVTASRRTSDPYFRAALLASAIAEGSADPMLSLELLGATHDLPPAEFLSLTKVSAPDFPWGERWLLGMGGEHVAVFDFEPPAGPEWAPWKYRFRPHDGNLTDVIPLRYDTAFITRDQEGEVRVWRLRETGQVGLAAEAPKRCVLGPVVASSQSPIIACASAEGIVRWDLRDADRAAVDPFVGRVLDVSPDGDWVVAARLRKLLLWNAVTRERHELELDEAPSAARISPRDDLVAVVHGGKLEVLTLQSPASVLSRSVTVHDPVAARWAPSGVDVAVCDYAGDGEWHYLRNGARAAEDPPLPTDPKPCAERLPAAPALLEDARDYGDIGRAGVGPRVFEQGWQRKDGTLVTRDLVMFKPEDRQLRRLVQHRAQASEEAADEGTSAALVFRDGQETVWQIDDHVRVHDLDGKEVMRKKGQLLMSCPNGRLLSWRRRGHADNADVWELFDARHEIAMGSTERRGGSVLGADPGCQKVVIQWLDGTLAVTDVGGTGSRPLEPAAGAFVIDGYAYDARPSHGRDVPGEAWPDGLWLAFSNGAMVRVDATDARVRPYGHASPRAFAMADGPEPGDLLFADDRGIVLRSGLTNEDEVIVRPMPDREWQDIALDPSRSWLWLTWPHGVVVVDMSLRDVVGELEVPAHDRFARWDESGSLLLWSFAFRGQPEGYVIPLHTALARQIGGAASNIRAPLMRDMRAVITLDD